MSPARTSATTHSRSTILRDVGIACPTPAKCTGSCRVTIASTTPTRTCGASPDTKNPLGSAPLWNRLERRDGPLRIRGRTTGPTRQARGRSRNLRVCESKYPCQVARCALGYTKVRYYDIAKKADAHPSETIQTQVATRVSCTPASNLIELGCVNPILMRLPLLTYVGARSLPLRRPDRAARQAAPMFPVLVDVGVECCRAMSE